MKKRTEHCNMGKSWQCSPVKGKVILKIQKIWWNRTKGRKGKVQYKKKNRSWPLTRCQEQMWLNIRLTKYPLLLERTLPMRLGNNRKLTWTRRQGQHLSRPWIHCNITVSISGRKLTRSKFSHYMNFLIKVWKMDWTGLREQFKIPLE